MYAIRKPVITLNHYNVFVVFLFILFLDFGGAFGIRYIAYLFVVFYIILNVVNNNILIPKSFLVLETPIFFILPFILVLFSVMFYSVHFMTAIGLINSFFLWFIYLLLINLRSPDQLINAFKKVGYFFVKIILITFLVIFLLIQVGQFSLISQIQDFANEFRIGYIGLQPSPDGTFYTNYPNVYFRWSMLLIPLCILFIKDNKVKFVVTILAISLITSTGLLLFTLLGIALFYISESLSKKKFVKNMSTILFGLLIIIMVFYFFDMDNIISKLTIESTSTSIKLGHISSATEEIFSNPLTFLFGSGLGSAFYSIGTNELTSEIEVSHINMIRQFGIIYFLIFTIYIGVVIFGLLKTNLNGKKLAIGLLMFYGAAGTNPLLLSPLFILVLIIAKSYLYLFNKKIHEKSAHN